MRSTEFDGYRAHVPLIRDSVSLEANLVHEDVVDRILVDAYRNMIATKTMPYELAITNNENEPPRWQEARARWGKAYETSSTYWRLGMSSHNCYHLRRRTRYPLVAVSYIAAPAQIFSSRLLDSFVGSGKTKNITRVLFGQFDRAKEKLWAEIKDTPISEIDLSLAHILDSLSLKSALRDKIDLGDRKTRRFYKELSALMSVVLFSRLMLSLMVRDQWLSEFTAAQPRAADDTRVHRNHRNRVYMVRLSTTGVRRAKGAHMMQIL